MTYKIKTTCKETFIILLENYLKHKFSFDGIIEEDSWIFNFIKEHKLEYWLEEIQEPLKSYEAGDYLYCLKDFMMGSGKIAYKAGRVYLSELCGCLTDEDGTRGHIMGMKNITISGELIGSFFRKAKDSEIEPESHWKNLGGVVHKSGFYRIKDSLPLLSNSAIKEVLFNAKNYEKILEEYKRKFL